jgi:arginase
MKIQVLVVPYDSGHKNVRMGKGPERFIESGLAQMLQTQGHEINVTTVEVEDRFTSENQTTFKLCRLLSKQVQQARSNNSFPIILSGNCIFSLGTIAGIDPIQTGVVWFDAHADFGTPETSLDGFLDGMGLAVLAGQCWRLAANSIPGFRPIPGSNIVHVGGRLHAVTKLWLQQANTLIVEADTIRQLGTHRALDRAVVALRTQIQRIYLHLDLDVLDPEKTPANEYGQQDGLSLEHVEEAIQILGEQFDICSCGVASYDPSYDEHGHTLQVGLKLISKVVDEFGKRHGYALSGGNADREFR